MGPWSVQVPTRLVAVRIKKTKSEAQRMSIGHVEEERKRNDGGAWKRQTRIGNEETRKSGNQGKQDRFSVQQRKSLVKQKIGKS